MPRDENEDELVFQRLYISFPVLRKGYMRGCSWGRRRKREGKEEMEAHAFFLGLV